MGEIGSSHWTIYPKMASGWGSSIKSELSTSATAAAPGMTSAFVKEAGKGAPQVGRKFGDSFKSALTPIMAVASVAAIGSFVKSAVDDFSQLQDATAAAAVIFGDSMDKIIAQSETAAETMFMSKQQVIDAANTFGTYGKSANLAGDDLAEFSTTMTQLAGDMASFKGTSTEQAVEAVGAAMRGEMEPIRAYGVMLDDLTLRQQAMKLGLISTTKEALTPQQKVLAAQAAILAQTTDAQGDAIRTQDSAASVAKRLAVESANLSAEMGEKLEPAITAAKRAGIGFIDFVRENQAALIPMAAAATTGAAALGGFVLVSKGIEAVKSARDTIAGLGDAFTSMSTKARAATIAAGGIGIALAVAAGIYSIFAQANATSQQKVEDFTEAIKADSGALGENSRAVAANALQKAGAITAAEKLGISAETAVDAALGEASAIAEVTAAYERHKAEVVAAASARTTETEGVQGQRDAYFDQRAALTEAADAYNLLTGQIGANSDAVGKAKVAEAQLKAGIGGTSSATGRAATATDRYTMSTEDSTVAQKLFTASLKKTSDALSLSSEIDQYKAAIDGVAVSVKENGKTVDAGTEKGRANRDALRDVAEAGLAVAGSMAEVDGNTKRADGQVKKTRERFLDLAESLTGSKKEARALAREMGLIKPKTVDFKVRIRATGNVDPSSGLQVYVTGSGRRLMASGGKVPGVALHDRDDKVPVLATPDEWMIRRRATRYYGDDIMAAINSARIPREVMQGFADGGKIGATSTASGLGASSPLGLREALSGMELRLVRTDLIADYVVGRLELAKEMA